jgi:CBS domain-containing protein
MKVSDILRFKGTTLYTVAPDTSLAAAVHVMAEKDIGSLVVMKHSELVGILTFREVINTLAKSHGTLGHALSTSIGRQHTERRDLFLRRC